MVLNRKWDEVFVIMLKYKHQLRGKLECDERVAKDEKKILKEGKIWIPLSTQSHCLQKMYLLFYFLFYFHSNYTYSLIISVLKL